MQVLQVLQVLQGAWDHQVLLSRVLKLKLAPKLRGAGGRGLHLVGVGSTCTSSLLLLQLLLGGDCVLSPGWTRGSATRTPGRPPAASWSTIAT